MIAIDMNNSQILLEAVSPTLQYIGISLKNPHPFTIERGKIYSVIGENGCGKTTLGNIIEKGWNIATNVIRGEKKSLQIKSVEFTDIHALTGFAGAYYQQRFESMMNDDIPTVEQLIEGKIDLSQWQELCQRLNVNDILHKRINFLSSGELRKFLIINILSLHPDILIIDNPFIGLDADSRDLFNELIASISAQGTAIMLLLCNPTEIPSFTDFVLPMKNLEVGKMIAATPETIDAIKANVTEIFSKFSNVNDIPFANDSFDNNYNVAFELDHCNVMYGKHKILHEVCWQVKSGEKWALLGENGSGKSTMLSLVYADNPQGYSNNITIFDHKRGTGESIWDIKSRIGYISPEMHLYFNGIKPVIDIVASGFHSNIGLYRRATDEEIAVAHQWLKALRIDHLAQRRFPTLSSGEQRLVLLVRTLIKQAPLLILDEPLHGLDMTHKNLVAQIIEHIAATPNATLIYVTHYTDEIPSCVNQIFTLTKFRQKE